MSLTPYRKGRPARSEYPMTSAREEVDNGPYTVIGDPDEMMTSGPTPAVKERIGEYLVRVGAMSEASVDQVLVRQPRGRERFGELAVTLGLVHPEQVEAALAAQYGYHEIGVGRSSISARVVSAYESSGPVAEAVRTLRTQLLSRWYRHQSGWPSLAVVGAERGEGRSFLCANLAVSFAQLGRRTLLVDADLRHPTQHQIFNVPNRSGLAGILAGRAGLGEILALERMPRLALLPAGAPVPNPQELVAGDAMPALLESLAGRYDVVLLDSPASSESADAQLIAIHARGALLVARRNLTRERQLATLNQTLKEAGIPIVGFAWNQ